MKAIIRKPWMWFGCFALMLCISFTCGISKTVRGNGDPLSSVASLVPGKPAIANNPHEASLLASVADSSGIEEPVLPALILRSCNRDLNEDRQIDSLDLQWMINGMILDNPSQLCLDMNEDHGIDHQDAITLIDNILSAQECIDLDQDGYEDLTCGGTDCNDQDPNVYPGAVEICSNSVDENCSGSDLDCETCEENEIGKRCRCGNLAYETGFCCSAIWQSMACENEVSEAIIADHTAVDLSLIPMFWIDRVQQDIRIFYGHASHGSQLNGGLQRISDQDNQYAFIEGDQLPLVPDALNALNTYNDPVLFFSRVQGVLDSNPSINVAMFSWCGEAAWYDVNQYISQMEVLEAANPGVTFVYMTGNAQEGFNAGYGRYQFNQTLRKYAQEHNKVLFDFADLDLWYGDEFTPNTYDWDDDGSKSLVKDIPLEHPNWNGDDWGHASWASCENKARAVWWMLARIAGWDGKGIE